MLLSWKNKGSLIFNPCCYKNSFTFSPLYNVKVLDFSSFIKRKSSNLSRIQRPFACLEAQILNDQQHMWQYNFLILPQCWIFYGSNTHFVNQFQFDVVFSINFAWNLNTGSFYSCFVKPLPKYLSSPLWERSYLS